mmetsp:Transcript_48699/g.66215  ORF Transcript_48699/g.66215 Transcript_48699/m.66215 type:complete len:89 (-) Transcript_48699:40-306(-)
MSAFRQLFSRQNVSHFFLLTLPNLDVLTSVIPAAKCTLSPCRSLSLSLSLPLFILPRVDLADPSPFFSIVSLSARLGWAWSKVVVRRL